MFPCPGRGNTPSQTLPRLVASLSRSSPRRLLSETWKYRSLISRGARSLIMIMNVSETANFMLVFCRHTVVYIMIVPYHAQILPRSVPSLPPILLSETLKNMSFPCARSLNIMMNISERACLKLDVIVLLPCYLQEIKFVVIFVKNMHQKLFFRAPNATISLPWEGGYLPWDPPPRPSPH